MLLILASHRQAHILSNSKQTLPGQGARLWAGQKQQQAPSNASPALQGRASLDQQGILIHA